MTFNDDNNVDPVPIGDINKVELDNGLVLRMEEFAKDARTAAAGDDDIHSAVVAVHQSSPSSLAAIMDDGTSRIIPSNQWIQGNDDLLPFPLKLHTVLDDAETKGFEHLISWHSG